MEHLGILLLQFGSASDLQPGRHDEAQILFWVFSIAAAVAQHLPGQVCLEDNGPDRAGGVHLVGLVVKASAPRVEDPGFESRLRRDFSRSSHTSDFKTGTPVATLPGAWHYRVSAGTGWPGVSKL